MAISNPPKGNGDKVIGAEFAPLSVTAQSIPNNTVAVRAGSYFNAAGEFKEFAGGNITVNIAPGQPEWVLVYFDVSGSLAVVPSPAGLGLPIPNEGELPLAAIYINAPTAITNDIIYDARPLFVSQQEVVAGGIQNALDDRVTDQELTDAQALKADLAKTSSAIFELGEGTSGSDIDLVAAAGVIRFNNSTQLWELSTDSGANFNDIGTVQPVWGSITGTLASQGDLNTELVGLQTGKADLIHTHPHIDTALPDSFLLNIQGESILTLADVDSNNAPTLNQVLMWNNTNWSPSDLPDHDVAEWGKITGALSAQTDLNSALTAKADKIIAPAGGNLVKVNATGDLLDSGFRDSDFELADPAIQAHLAIVSGNPHGTDISDLASVTITGPANGEVLTFDGSKWVNLAAGGGAPITSVFGRTGVVVAVNGDYSKADVGLGNVDDTTDLLKPISNATQTALDLKVDNNDLTNHTSDATIHFTEASINITASQISDFDAAADARIAAASIDALVDVDTTTAAPTNNQVLAWDGSNWVPTTDVNGATSLDGLADVTILNAASGEALMHDGTDFKNRALTNADVGLGNVDNTADVDKPVSIAATAAFATTVQGDTADSATQPGDGLETLVNTTTLFTTDAAVAINHYTKTESDATTPAVGAKVNTVAGASGNIVEFTTSNAIVDSNVATADLAPLASPVFTGAPVMPSYTVAQLVAITPPAVAGAFAYASNANGGTGAMCYGDGTIWRDAGTNLLVVV